MYNKLRSKPKKKKTKFQKFMRMANISVGMCLATIIKSFSFALFATRFTKNIVKEKLLPSKKVKTK